MQARDVVERAMNLMEAKAEFTANPKLLDNARSALAGDSHGWWRSLRGQTQRNRQAANWLVMLQRTGIDPDLVHAMVEHDLDEVVVCMAADGGLTGPEVRQLIAEHGTLDEASVRMLAALRGGGF